LGYWYVVARNVEFSACVVNLWNLDADLEC